MRTVDDGGYGDGGIRTGGEGDAVAMVTRLSASDSGFYRLENSSTPMYVGSLSILRKPRGGLSYESVLATVERRLPQIPRYRQKVREVSLGLARPVWIDDADFDITYHVRRSALPSPGSDAQLHDLIARIGSRPMDKSRPLWEMYIVEGLTRNRIAIYTKSHQALVNGMSALEIGHVIADRTPKSPEFGEDIWIPAREPSDVATAGRRTRRMGRPARPRSPPPCARRCRRWSPTPAPSSTPGAASRTWRARWPGAPHRAAR